MKYDRAKGATTVPTTPEASPGLGLTHVDFRTDGSKVIAVFCVGWRGVLVKAGVPVCARCGEDLSGRIKAAT